MSIGNWQGAQKEEKKRVPAIIDLVVEVYIGLFYGAILFSKGHLGVPLCS